MNSGDTCQWALLIKKKLWTHTKKFWSGLPILRRFNRLCFVVGSVCCCFVMVLWFLLLSAVCISGFLFWRFNHMWQWQSSKFCFSSELNKCKVCSSNWNFIQFECSTAFESTVLNQSVAIGLAWFVLKYIQFRLFLVVAFFMHLARIVSVFHTHMQWFGEKFRQFWSKRASVYCKRFRTIFREAIGLIQLKDE